MTLLSTGPYFPLRCVTGRVRIQGQAQAPSSIRNGRQRWDPIRRHHRLERDQRRCRSNQGSNSNQGGARRGGRWECQRKGDESVGDDWVVEEPDRPVGLRDIKWNLSRRKLNTASRSSVPSRGLRCPEMTFPSDFNASIHRDTLAIQRILSYVRHDVISLIWRLRMDRQAFFFTPYVVRIPDR